MKTLVIVLLFTFNFLLPATNNMSLHHELEKIQQKYEIVGMSIALVDQGKVKFLGSYGQRDLTRKLPVNEKTQYRIASISKMIVAIAFMQLYEQGKVQLDTDVSSYLGFSLRNPKYPNQVITCQLLLSHTSSLRDGKGYFKFASAGASEMVTLSQLFQENGSFFTSDIYSSEKAPGHYFQYANINFGVLASIIEVASQQRFDQYCATNIFQPLGLQASFAVAALKDINNLAVLYRKKDQWQPQVDNYQGIHPKPRDLTKYNLGDNGFIFAPQGGLRASAQELAHITRNLLSDHPTLLSAKTRDLMLKTRWSFNGSNGNNYYGIFNTYALGNHTTTNLIPKESWIGHPGEAYGLISDCYFSFSTKQAIIFLTNGGKWGDGNYSGWYNLEEEIFQICRQYLETP